MIVRCGICGAIVGSFDALELSIWLGERVANSIKCGDCDPLTDDTPACLSVDSGHSVTVCHGSEGVYFDSVGAIDMGSLLR